MLEFGQGTGKKKEWTYPVFEVDEFFNKKLTAFKQAVPKISPDYFLANPRFSSLSRVLSPELVDYLGIYEEGDGWVLTVVKVIVNQAIEYLFLPFTSVGVQSGPLPYEELLRSKLRTPAFGFETNSPAHGKRQWQVVDALADYKFHQKLTNPFQPREGIPQNHVNAYVRVYESGIGRFGFESKDENKIPLLRKWKYEFQQSCFVIRWDNNSHLDLFQTLPAMAGMEKLKTSSKVLGWISYSGEADLQLLVGVLYRSTHGPE
jgi:hypothetical protein